MPARRRLPRLPAALAALCVAVLGTLGAVTFGPAGPAVAAAPLVTPKPTSTAVSPDAPDPHPPAGGVAPDGSVPGGNRLASRGTVVPAGAPRLPGQLPARAWILADLDTGDVLAARDPHGRYQPASILKLLTALTVSPHLPGGRVVVVSPQAANAEGSAVGLLAGGRYTVDQLFAALMLVSGNDAAAALAEANGGIARTVSQMNATALALGAYDTYIQTPSGLDGWQQLTSAYDMALVLQQVVHQPRLVHYDELPNASYPPRSSAYGSVGPYEFDNQSENFLTTVPGALLAKTGFTDAAQHTYLAAARRGGHTLGVVFLRNQRQPLDQYQQAAQLFDWGFAALKAGLHPVGQLTGPISAAAATSAASPTGTAATGRVARTEAASKVAAPSRSVGNWTVLVPLAAATAGGLWLGGVALAGRRMLQRRSSRPR